MIQGTLKRSAIRHHVLKALTRPWNGVDPIKECLSLYPDKAEAIGDPSYVVSYLKVVITAEEREKCQASPDDVHSLVSEVCLRLMRQGYVIENSPGEET